MTEQAEKRWTRTKTTRGWTRQVIDCWVCGKEINHRGDDVPELVGETLCVHCGCQRHIRRQLEGRA